MYKILVTPCLAPCDAKYSSLVSFHSKMGKRRIKENGYTISTGNEGGKRKKT